MYVKGAAYYATMVCYAAFTVAPMLPTKSRISKEMCQPLALILLFPPFLRGAWANKGFHKARVPYVFPAPGLGPSPGPFAAGPTLRLGPGSKPLAPGRGPRALGPGPQPRAPAPGLGPLAPGPGPKPRSRPRSPALTRGPGPRDPGLGSRAPGAGPQGPGRGPRAPNPGPRAKGPGPWPGTRPRVPGPGPWAPGPGP